jgi:hypothetical protein
MKNIPGLVEPLLLPLLNWCLVALMTWQHLWQPLLFPSGSQCSLVVDRAKKRKRKHTYHQHMRLEPLFVCSSILPSVVVAVKKKEIDLI